MNEHITIDDAIAHGDGASASIQKGFFAFTGDKMAAILAAEVRRLREENERMKADAERYQWLRENLNVTVSHWLCTDGGEKLDAAIDAARSAK